MKKIALYICFFTISYTASSQPTHWKLGLPQRINVGIDSWFWNTIGDKNYLQDFNDYYGDRGISYGYTPEAPMGNLGYGICSNIGYIRKSSYHFEYYTNFQNDGVWFYPSVSILSVGIHPFTFQKKMEESGQIDIHPLIEFTTEKANITLLDSIHDYSLSSYAKSLLPAYRKLKIGPAKKTVTKVGLLLVAGDDDFFKFSLSLKYRLTDNIVYFPFQGSKLKVQRWEFTFGFSVPFKHLRLLKFLK